METNPVATLLQEEAQKQAPAAEEAPAQPEQDMALRLRAQELITQARTILAVCQVDVLSVYNTDVEIRNRVLAGEMDFVDVYKAMKPSPVPPAPVRSVGGVTPASMDVSAMNDDQFQKLNALLRKGGKIDMTV